MSSMDSQTIQLDQFLKYIGAVATGGEAKLLIQDGLVEVNGEIEVRRRRKLGSGDVVTCSGSSYEVRWSDGPEPVDPPRPSTRPGPGVPRPRSEGEA
ncbi:MAG: RNA-binding S4 domain-containing protein [Planctomycetota bacterium]|nr:RNA-binding S4 domain-containing protein [Planctomycetota bacterium]